MRNLNELTPLRLTGPAVLKVLGNVGDEGNGVFQLGPLRVIATNEEGWDHVSVSVYNRTPTWDEMEYVKRLFFRDDEYAMQLHVPPSEHVNCHPYCLHLWRPQRLRIPAPPKALVGGLL